MVDRLRPLMEPGQVVATPGALAALEAAGESVHVYVTRHLSGDWGTTGMFDTTEVTERERQYGVMATSDDAKLNRLAVEANNGSRVLSTYVLADGTRLWVGTQGTGKDCYTCVMLPEEY